MTYMTQAQSGPLNTHRLMMRASGFIFDMDDLLVRSKAIWHEAITALLQDADLPVEQGEKLSYRGLSAADTARLFHETLGAEQNLQAFQRAFVEQLLNVVQRRQVVPLPGAVEALKRASAAGPVAVASGSPLEVIHCILSQIGVIDDIKVVLSSEEVELGKPEPDVFLEAARLLKINPSECVVFEDSVVGVQAAVSAGSPCIAVPSESPDTIQRLTRYTYESLMDLPWSN